MDNLITIQAKETDVFPDMDVFLRFDQRIIGDDDSELKNFGTLFVPIGGLKVYVIEASVPFGSGHEGVIFVHLFEGQIVDRHTQKQ